MRPFVAALFAAILLMAISDAESYKVADDLMMPGGRFGGFHNAEPVENMALADIFLKTAANYQPHESHKDLDAAIKHLIDSESANFQDYRLGNDVYTDEDNEMSENEHDLLSSAYVSNFVPRGEEELEDHSSLISGFQYVSGGAGEGKQHLQPDGSVANKEEVKTDGDLPAYCNPPNPCPLGYTSDDCDPSPYSQYSAEYSKKYQEKQNCMCDSDHNTCPTSINSEAAERVSALFKDMQSDQSNNLSPVVAKKSPRFKRSLERSAHKLNKILKDF